MDGRIRCFQAEFKKAVDEGKPFLLLRLQNAAGVWKSPLGEAPHFAAMVENTAESVFFKDRNHVFVAASRSFGPEVSQVLGDRKLLGLTDYDFLPEADADQYYEAEERAIRGGVAVEEVLEVVRPGEGKQLMYVHHRPVKTADGSVIGIFTTARNLTQRIQAEEKPDEALHNAGVGSYVLDLRRGAAATSASLDVILGLDKEYPRDLGGWQDLIHSEDREGTIEYLASVVRVRGRIFNREYRIRRHSDGAVRWIQAIGRIDRDAEGQPLLMRGTLQDITERKKTEAALRETKKRLELFIEHAPAALAMYDCEMRYVAVSRRWREVYQVGDEIIGRRHYDVVPDIPERWRELHRRSLAGESLSCEEDRFDRADGSVLWIRWEMMPWRFDDGSVGGILLFVEDVTDRKRAEQRLKLAASVFADASEAIFVTDLGGNIVEVNESFTRTTGYSREEILGERLHILKSERHNETFYRELGKSVRQTGRWSGEQWFRRKDGSAFEVNATISTVFDSSGKPAHYVALFIDITPLKEQERRLVQATYFDELTSLPNRALISERLRQAMTAAGHLKQMVGVIFFDFDDFKRINEVYGRQAADSVLVAVSTRMKQVLGEGDTLGRMGGDEFLVVLPNLSGTEGAVKILERLLQAVSEPHSLGDGILQLCATAGATFYPQAEEVDADQMIRQAVQATYEAKLAGKNRYHVFDPARDYSLRDRNEEVGRIRQAVRAGEFVLYYQPKVNMATGALVGAEALIRWQHPQRGLLAPGTFLPAIEGHELAIEVGEWVIESALCQVEQWAQEGHRIPVSVNVSARQLQQADFVERLRTLLRLHPKADPKCLELEIVENSMVQDVEHVSAIIRACVEMGIQVAIDDFGIGYSSLSYLKRLPAPVIKIDRTFVNDMLENPDDLAILQGVMGLANAFHRTVVAEGVETIEQGTMLLKLGCTYAQGYGIARPMPAEELVKWYSNWWPHALWRNVDELTPQDWPILVAQVEVRFWSRRLERFMSGMEAVPPELDEKRCRFGTWLESEKSGSRGGGDVLRELDVLHRDAHLAARRAVEMKQSGNMDEAMALMRASIESRVQIESGLSRLLVKSAGAPGGKEGIRAAAKRRRR